jgi:biotin-dependent carboxylase-like uncharacterized protein
MKAQITVLRAGLATLQDLGRHGFEHVGIAVNGAADQVAARVANTLVGNAESAPLIEIVASDFVFDTSAPLLLAVTGAPATVTVDGHQQRPWEPMCLLPGQRVAVCRIHHGLRTYIAVAGTLDVQYIMGSCAPDSLLEIGRQLLVGDTLQVDSRHRPLDHPFFRHPLFALQAPVPEYGTDWRIPVTEGPDLDDYDDGLARLCDASYRVGARSNHIGLRLEGSVPPRRVTHEILSRGVPIGAIEAPPGGGLLALQRGRPVTAGYPVLAVATHAGRRALGQAAPGHTVRFHDVTLDEAITAHQRTVDAIGRLRRRVHAAFDSLGLHHDPAERTSA